MTRKTSKTKALSQKEYSVQKAVAEYLRLQYPGVVFRSDYGGIRMGIGLATKMKALQPKRHAGYPDLFIAEMRRNYGGLFIEIKKDGTKIRQKSNKKFATSHIEDQALVLYNLRRKGYLAVFAIGFEECKAAIDVYLSRHDFNYAIFERLIRREFRYEDQD